MPKSSGAVLAMASKNAAPLASTSSLVALAFRLATDRIFDFSTSVERVGMEPVFVMALGLAI